MKKTLISKNFPQMCFFNVFDLHLLQVTNVAETLGLGKKTPMGIFLDEFGIEPEVKYM